MPLFESQEAMSQEVRCYSEAGWAVIPCDDPEHGEVGHLAFREQNGEEETVLLSWYPFGPRSPEVTYATSEESFEAALVRLGSGPRYRCDDPKRLLLGLVTYPEGETVARILQVRLTTFSGFGDASKKAVLSVGTLSRT
jgi:hypothetical protein